MSVSGVTRSEAFALVELADTLMRASSRLDVQLCGPIVVRRALTRLAIGDDRLAAEIARVFIAEVLGSCPDRLLTVRVLVEPNPHGEYGSSAELLSRALSLGAAKAYAMSAGDRATRDDWSRVARALTDSAATVAPLVTARPADVMLAVELDRAAGRTMGRKDKPS